MTPQSHTDPSATPFTATEEEEQLATQILVIKNCHTTGILNADAAIDIFKRSGLSVEMMRDIWTLSDKNRSGDFSRDELTVALRLMGWVQTGETLHEGLLAKEGPLPTLDGISDVVKTSANIPPIFPPQIPRIKPDEVRDYRKAFIRAGPVDGYLEGDKVMGAFMTSNLSYEHLRKIHDLVDRSQQGTLEFREFALGMHLIHALQACYIFTVPSSIPQYLYQQFANLEIPDLLPQQEVQSIPSHRSRPSLRVASTSSLGSGLSPAASRSRSSSPKSRAREDHWDVTPQQKQEFDSYFYKLDLDRKGYVDEDTAANFMLAYQLPPGDLAHIWGLVDLNRDDHLTIDEFAVAMYLIQRKAGGEELPKTLPVSLIPPSLRSRFAPKASPTSPKSPINKGKPPPPPPKRERSILNGQNSISMRSRSISSVALSTPLNSKYSAPLSPPISPKPSRLRSRASVSGPSTPAVASPAAKPVSELLSPFEDPAHQPLHFSPSQHHTPAVQSTPSPSPRPPDIPNNEALEEFKKETARLSAQVESLLSQLTAQNRLRDSNENLRNENDTLKSQLRDMERTVSEVLSANDMNGSQEQLMQEITRLTADVANKEAQVESAERMVLVLSEEEKELRASLREAQAATTRAKSEADELRQTVATQAAEIIDLSGRLADMSNAMAEPTPNANNRQLRLVFKDVTKENEKLKGEVRDMQKSMEQLLLSTKFHAQYDELDRENRRLKHHIQELEIIATTSHQSSSASSHSSSQSQNGHGNGNGRLSKSNSNSSRSVESLSRENEQLKAQLREGQRVFADFRSTSETKSVELQQQIDSLTHENNRLKIDAAAAAQSSGRTRRPSQEDNNVPPPSYDDSFVVPP
ncbi:hypothetical protein M413DRAFT_440303 [Hebeloma cylindrosporum]|uniref:Uncharacterized protein n=1 Tax=Hebeloma cylindrosporum TaxID=76867 RepID=A0A0C2YA66_HEBCY|nr:hypothetical protein M413DRAFT_440303 [Hebeloma cylindrosporum h7]